MTNRLVTAYRKWRRYHQTYNELMRLTDRDLADIGISRADIGRTARRFD